MSSDLSGFSLMELFRMEAESHTASLTAGLLALEGSTAAPVVIEPLMRSPLDQSAARIVGLNAVVHIAHAMEDCFSAAQKGELALHPQIVDVLLRGVDVLVHVARLGESDIEAWQLEHAGEIESLLQHLTAMREGQACLTQQQDRVAALVPSPPQPLFLPDAQGPNLRDEQTHEPKISFTPLVSATVGSGNPEGASRFASSAPELFVGAGPDNQTQVHAPTDVVTPDVDRVVRMTAESLTRLMGLAGEALVQSQRLPTVVGTLRRLKGRQTRLLEALDLLEDRLSPRGLTLAAAERELLTNAKSEAAQCLQQLSHAVEEIEEYTRGSEVLSTRLHHEVLTSRMRPLQDGVRGFARLVRDLARELGKQARFELLGESTGVDRDILERLEAPLNHLIRNAIDHGIEPPEERLVAGKSPVGTIRLAGRHRAGTLQLILSDDGRGIDLHRLRAKIVERGLTTPVLASRLSEAELLDFLFLPGFSTTEQVTEVSGRGVGLDVVLSTIHAVRGTVSVTNRPGMGVSFTLQLPITVSVIRALLVDIAGEPYAFPLHHIERIATLNHSDLHELEGKHYMMLDDQPVGLVEAAVVFELSGKHIRDSESRLSVVIASDRSHRFGVVVDRFLGEKDLRVSPLDPRLGKVPNINSTSVMDNGWPVLLIDVEDLIRSIDNLLSGRRLGRLPAQHVGQETHAPKRVLVVDDSITVRELERQLLENRGYVVDTAVDGVDGWNAVRSTRYDLVVSDIDMPRMDGIRLVQHIKQDPRLRAVPVVIVSYKDREEDRIRGLDAGATSYLTKSSFHDQTFLTTVADLIGEPID